MTSALPTVSDKTPMKTIFVSAGAYFRLNQISVKLLHLLYNPMREIDSLIWLLQESLQELNGKGWGISKTSQMHMNLVGE